jgi:hypothetical protein
LVRFSSERFTVYTTLEGLSHNEVYSIYEDSDGTLWIGTAGGLNRFQGGVFKTITTKDGLFDDVVYVILDDGRGNFWMTCNKGIFRVSKKELEALAQGQIKTVTSLAYGTADGMRSRECNGGFQPAGWKARDGKLWFPTLKGVVAIDPTQIKTNELVPPVVIEQFIVNHQAVDSLERPQLPPGQGELEVQYTALSFLAPEKVRFRYQLEGYDRDWIDAGTRRAAYYTNIPPGDYRFRVVACNNDGVWNEVGAALEFRLDPAVYETPVVYALGGLALVLIAWGLHRLRVRQLEARENELTQRVEETLAAMKVLSGLLPICSSCKKIRDDRGYWNQIEAYIRDHSEAEFTHSICPECVKKLYPGAD